MAQHPLKKPPCGPASGGMATWPPKTPVQDPLQRLRGGLLSPAHTQLSLYCYCKIHSKLANRGRARPRVHCFGLKRPLSGVILEPILGATPSKGTRMPPKWVHTSNGNPVNDPLGWYWAQFRRPTDPLAHVGHPRMAVINPLESNKSDKLARIVPAKPC